MKPVVLKYSDSYSPLFALIFSATTRQHYRKLEDVSARFTLYDPDQDTRLLDEVPAIVVQDQTVLQGVSWTPSAEQWEAVRVAREARGERIGAPHYSALFTLYVAGKRWIVPRTRGQRRIEITVEEV